MGSARSTHLVGQSRPAHRARPRGARDRRVGRGDRHERLSFPAASRRLGRARSKDRVGHYTFVSSLSVYADASRPGLDETTPVADARRSALRGHHGALRRAQGALRGRDPRGLRSPRARRAARSHRRTARPDRPLRLLGRPVRLSADVSAREPVAAVVPGPPDRAVQFIDARDLASWMLDMTEQRADGTFDACSPAGTWTFGALVDVLVAAARAAGSATVPRWIDDDALRPPRRHALDRPAAVDSRLRPGVGRLHAFRLRSRQARGLAIRPLAQTVADTAAWLRAREDVRRVEERAVGRAGTRTCWPTSTPRAPNRARPLPCDHSRRHFLAGGSPSP